MYLINNIIFFLENDVDFETFKFLREQISEFLNKLKLEKSNINIQM